MEFQISIKFDTDSSSFNEHSCDYESEVAKVMKQATDFISTMPAKGSLKKLKDTNGNTVGTVEILPF